MGNDFEEPLTIPWPRVAPLGVPVGYAALQEVWDTFVKPHQEQHIPPSVEMRVLMAVLRSVAAGIEEEA